MNDPRKILTEETPEPQQDFSRRDLTEVGGQTQACPKPQTLTETLPIEEDEDQQPRTLLG